MKNDGFVRRREESLYREIDWISGRRDREEEWTTRSNLEIDLKKRKNQLGKAEEEGLMIVLIETRG